MRIDLGNTHEITKLGNNLREERNNLNNDELAPATTELEFSSVHCGHSKS